MHHHYLDLMPECLLAQTSHGVAQPIELIRHQQNHRERRRWLIHERRISTKRASGVEAKRSRMKATTRIASRLGINESERPDLLRFRGGDETVSVVFIFGQGFSHRACAANVTNGLTKRIDGQSDKESGHESEPREARR